MDSTAWQAVSVSLHENERHNKNNSIGEQGSSTDEHAADYGDSISNDNHYDNPALQRAAAKDLPAQPGEEMAMFYGLEVLDGSQYRVVDTGKSKRLVVLETNATDKQSSATPASATNKKSEEKKRKEEQKKRLLDSEPEVEDGGKSSTEHKLPKTKASTPTAKSSSPQEETVPSDDDTRLIQQNWSQATGGAVLHPKLCTSLFKLKFLEPTPIQAATLSASVLGRRNLVGTAPTGSGKTLAFLLPILQSILDNSDNHSSDATGNSKLSHPVRALIVAPTRELAIQIHDECDKLVKGLCISLVGGIALVKQKRILDTKRPPIVIGTPGRLWAMISSGEHLHLRDMSQVQFLVLDEADRLTQDHCFPQLVQILDFLHDANPGVNNSSEEVEDDDDDHSMSDRLLGLPGIRGEAPLQMLTPELLQAMDESRAMSKAAPQDLSDDDEYSNVQDNDDVDIAMDADINLFKDVQKPSVHRQTFIYSATLSLANLVSTSGRSPKGQDVLENGGISEILKKCNIMGETKVVDMSLKKSSSTAGTNETGLSSAPSGVTLPPGLKLEQIRCTQRHKDSHLYAYLMTTAQGASGPCLVFCNSVAGVRRVGATLQTLGFPVRILHSHMQQRARFKAVESLEGSTNRAVVVCTDIAARGLDIPTVSTVVHYDVARSVDTFIHRSGRTARGVGPGAVGSSLSLIAPAEDKTHNKIVDSIQATFLKVMLDGRLMTAAQERTNLASKIVAANEMEQKTKSKNQWFLENAKEADLDVDTDLLDNELNFSMQEQAQLREAKVAKKKLRQLLAEPMKTQRYGKFLSTMAEAVQKGIAPPILTSVTTSPKLNNITSRKRRRLRK